MAVERAVSRVGRDRPLPRLIEREQAPACGCWQVEDLCLSYGERRAFSSVTLDIPERCVTAIVGPSGCGKSSFLYCLNRLSLLIPRCCVSGKLLFRAQDILHGNIDDRVLRRRVGLVLQKPSPFPFSIRRNLELPLQENGVRDRQEIAQRSERVLREVGLWEEVKDRLNTPATELSGGQQQRLCIARALALDPEALLFDEPCSSLDPISAARIEELIHQLRRERTIVIVTHDLGQARRLADNVAFFWMGDSGGRLVEFSEREAFFCDPKSDVGRLYVRSWTS